MTVKPSEYTITWVGLLQVKDRKVLMTREKGKSLFQLPGGGQDNNESNVVTLKREVKEELEAEITNPTLYDDAILPGRHENVMIRFIVYTADIVGGVKTGNEIEEIRWIDSNYEKQSLDIGNMAKMRIIPRLLREGLID